MVKTTFKHFLDSPYPPQNHMLRDLCIEVVTSTKDDATIRAPVVPAICSENGVLYVGLLATLVDVLGGLQRHTRLACPHVSV